MKKTDDLDLNLDVGPAEVTLLLFIIGIACVVYRYVPFYGATPLAIGLTLLLSSLLDKARRWVRR